MNAFYSCRYRLAASACHLGASAQIAIRAQRSIAITSRAFDKIESPGRIGQGRDRGQPTVSARGGDRLLDETEVFVRAGRSRSVPRSKRLHFGWGRRPGRVCRDYSNVERGGDRRIGRDRGRQNHW